MTSHALAVFEAFVAFAGLAIILAVSWRISSGGGGTAVSELSEANRVLEKRLHEQRVEFQAKIDELGAQVRDLLAKNAELGARTDYQAVINEHEKRAQARHDAQLAVLERIAERLGTKGEA